ncbi:MAG TPA: LamG-like jellyroll fold domain-containing protein [Kofleriaceae bacterium]|nr:LamG-like jellyroll fold domain-containing protein [Kofleriaceae bacterium]
MRSYVVVAGALIGLNACAGLDLSETQQNISPPVTVTATAQSDTQILVSWSAVPGAFKYFVEQSTAGGPFVFVGTTLEPGNSQLETRLTPSTQYAYQVIAVSTDGSESPPSAPVTATTLAVAPGAPTNVTATTVSSSQIDLSWTASPVAVKYFVFESQAGGPFAFRATVVGGNSTAFSATGLLSNTQYCYQLVSTLADGSESGPSTPPACATTGAGALPPTGVLATGITDTRVLVQWQPAAEASRYFVYQSQAGGPFAFRGSVLASQQSFLDVGLLPATQYCYQVTTVLASGQESARSATSCTSTLGAGGGDLQGYWRLDERGGVTAIDSSGFGRNGAISGASYSLGDRPNIDDDRSAISFTSSPDSAISVPSTPAFTLTVPSPFTVAFWTKIPAAADVTFIGMRAEGCGQLGWQVAQDANGLQFAAQGSPFLAGTSIPVGVWTHVAVTFTSSTMRFFVNGVETRSGSFGIVNPLQTTPLNIGHVGGCAGGAVLMDDVQIYGRALADGEVAVLGTLPPAPANLRITSTTSVSINLAWDPVPGATAYLISKGTAAGNEQFFTHSPADPPTFEADHLGPNTQSSWTVRAVVNHLFSNPSNEVIGTTNPPPAAPANVTATLIAPDRIQVDWSPVTGAFKYLVFMSTNGGPFVFRGSLLAPSTTFLAVSLAPATTYSFEVQAEDAVQTQGALSAPASATTP